LKQAVWNMAGAAGIQAAADNHKENHESD
jgi:hypothetical protein